MTEHSSQSAVLITGASSGIGAGLAREFSRRGFRVALVARRVEHLESLATELRAAGGQASAHRGDVTVDGDIAKVVAELATQRIIPSIVVANAGFGIVGNAQKLTLADYQRQFETNINGVLRTFYDTIDCLRRTRGRFVITGSVAGYVSAPGGSPYAMSKFAVRALAESLHGDLKSAGVGVTLLSPGFIDSEIRRIDNRGSLHAHVEDPIPDWLRMKTDQAARIMVKGILRGRKEVVVTFHGRVIIFFGRHLPRLTRFLFLRAKKTTRPEPGKKPS